MSGYNPWRGFILGAVGGAVGALTMKFYWDAVRGITGQDPRKARRQQPPPSVFQPLKDVSIFGKQHRQGESSTAALGRILYTSLMGKPPRTQEAETVMSYLVHYVISMGYAGLYSALRGDPETPDVTGGVLMGTTLWLFGDELFMPLAGLTKGPAAYPLKLHLHSWAAHIVYGIGAALATQLLEEAVAEDKGLLSLPARLR
jgi:hypothetical protein